MLVSIENSSVLVSINLSGGSLIDFHFKEMPINPISFKDPVNPIFMGHFLCFDRWGPPTNAEKANGFIHHGEANTQVWKLISEPQINEASTGLSMMCGLPMGGLQLTRKIELSENEPVFFVKEEIKNLNKYGRMFNIVQHVTIAPPFLDKSTLIDNNTEKGFEDKLDGSLYQEDPVYIWPDANHNGKAISLRQFQNEWPLVSSFMYNRNNKYAWVTASNPQKNLMLGYIWKTEDYPWINFWRSMKNGIPMAFGMEFGTTGLHESFPILAKKGKIFDRNIYAFIDADEVISKSYTAFLSKIPLDYKGVQEINVHNSLITIKEINNKRRDITYHLKECN
jgi:hypothetical protein